MDEAVELGQRAIYHATFRDAASGGTVSGGCLLALVLLLWAAPQCLCSALALSYCVVVVLQPDRFSTLRTGPANKMKGA